MTWLLSQRGIRWTCEMFNKVRFEVSLRNNNVEENNGFEGRLDWKIVQRETVSNPAPIKFRTFIVLDPYLLFTSSA